MSPSVVSAIIKVGNVCRCKQKRLGVVHSIMGDQGKVYGRTTFYGVGFDGRSWTSVQPEFVASNIEDYMNKQLSARSQDDKQIGTYGGE